MILLVGCSCNPTQIKTDFDPYANGIDEEQIPFIVSANGSFYDVQKQCVEGDHLLEDHPEGCKDWEHNFLTFDYENIAEIEAEIRAANNGKSNKIDSILNILKDKIHEAKSKRKMYR